jgi:hypothetical protein
MKLNICVYLYRESCLLYFSEDTLEAGREGSMTCPICAQANRPSNIRIQDIVVPEVFISYNWGFKLSTQVCVHAHALVDSHRMLEAACMWQ